MSSTTFTSRTAEIDRLLTALGAVKAVASYEGGNDDGFVEPALLYLADGTTRQAAQDQSGWIGGNTAPPTEQDKLDYQLNAIMEQPVYDKYHSFAGEFSCYGTVTAELGQGLLVSGEESTYVGAW